MNYLISQVHLRSLYAGMHVNHLLSVGTVVLENSLLGKGIFSYVTPYNMGDIRVKGNWNLNLPVSYLFGLLQMMRT